MTQQEELQQAAVDEGWIWAYRYTTEAGEQTYRALGKGGNRLVLWFRADGRLSLAKKFATDGFVADSSPVFSTVLGWF